MKTTKCLAVAALALVVAGAPVAASAFDGRGHHRGHGNGHWKKHYKHHGHYGYAPYRYAPYRYAPVRYVYVRRPARVYYREVYPDYPPPYAYYRSARPGVSVSVSYADGPFYAGYGRYVPY